MIGETHEKSCSAPNLHQTSKIWPRIRFFAIFSSLVHELFFELHRVIAWNNVQLLVEVKVTKTIGRPKIGSKIRFFHEFLKFALLVFLDITPEFFFSESL